MTRAQGRHVEDRQEPTRARSAELTDEQIAKVAALLRPHRELLLGTKDKTA